MRTSMQPLRDSIIALASRPEGVEMDALRALGFNEKQIEKSVYDFRRAGHLFGFRRKQMAVYFTSKSHMDAAIAEWEVIAKERDRKRKADKAARRIERREAAKAAGIIKPKPRVRPDVAKPALQPKPAISASVHIKAYGRGPAYLPGEPRITAATKFTFGRSPSNPTHTTTHAE